MSGIDFPIDPISSRNVPDPLAAAQESLAQAAAQRAKASEAAKDFESVLLGRLMDEMKRTIPDSGLLSSGVTKQMQDMFWMYLSQDLADKGGLGLWKDVYNEYGGGQEPEPPSVEQSL